MSASFAYDLIGYFSMLLGMFSYTIVNRSRMLFVRAVADFTFAIHFHLIGGWHGAVISVLYSVSNFLGIPKFSKLQQIIIRGILMIVAIYITYVSYEKPSDVLPCIGAIVSIIQASIRNNVAMRYIIIFAVCPIWFVYSYISGSTPCMVAQVIYVITTSIGIYRIYNKDSKFEKFFFFRYFRKKRN